MTRDDVTEGMQEAMLGFLVGYLICVTALYLMEEWLVASELAERRRVRTIIWEMLQEERAKRDDVGPKAN